MFLLPTILIKKVQFVTFLSIIQFAIGLTTLKLKPEQAGVLVALHHLCRGELNLEIPLSELQAKLQHNYHFRFSVDELDEILDDLLELRCIRRQQEVIYLTEKIILKEAPFNYLEKIVNSSLSLSKGWQHSLRQAQGTPVNKLSTTFERCLKR